TVLAVALPLTFSPRPSMNFCSSMPPPQRSTIPTVAPARAAPSATVVLVDELSALQLAPARLSGLGRCRSQFGDPVQDDVDAVEGRFGLAVLHPHEPAVGGDVEGRLGIRARAEPALRAQARLAGRERRRSGYLDAHQAIAVLIKQLPSVARPQRL